MKTSALTITLLASIGTGSVTASDLLFEPGKDSRFNWDSYSELKKVDLKGQTLTIAGPWLGADKELAESVLAYFEAATGVDIQYAGSDSFEQQIVIDVQAGSPPDIAIFPQPGLAADLAAKGFLSPLDEQLGKWVEENYAAGSSWVDLGTFPDQQGQEQLFGFFYKIDLKSLVWFVPENFEDAGYEVPESMEELKTLTQQIVDDGETPWCIGVGSGGATGWPATDWVEDIMLRLFEPTVYDQWTTNAIPFNDDKVIEAIEDFGWFVKNDGFVDGGARAVAATDFRDSPKGLFSSPPRCYMHRQASFISSFFPEGSELGVDADFFYFPAYASKDLGKPVMGAGTLWSITNDTPAAREFIKFLQTPIAHEVWMAQSGFLTPFKSANVEAYGNDTLKKQGQILLDASTFRFDGSDLMPGKIGAGAFWTGMVDYTGGKSAKEVGDFIQSTWDTLK